MRTFSPTFKGADFAPISFIPPANREEREDPLKAVTKNMPATTPIPTSEAATSDDLRFITITPQYNTSQKNNSIRDTLKGKPYLITATTNSP
jgi:hypothetical protein